MRPYIHSFLIICTICLNLNAGKLITDAMIGHWQGAGKIIVTWCEQDSLAFDIQIDRDGNVKGKAGDAEIISGKLELNNLFLRMIGNVRYVIDFKLNGELVESEKIRRSG